MTVSGVSAASSNALSQQVQPLTQHKRGGRYPSISDVDMQSASAGSAPSQHGKAGNKIDITA
jgi:hypothetical protein